MLSVKIIQSFLGPAGITANGLRLGEGGELEEQMFNLPQMFNRIPNVQLSTEPAFLQNPCYRLPF